MTDAQKFQTELEALGQFIEDATRQAQDGKMISMERVEREVDLLCRQIERAPGPVAHGLKPLLAETISKLDMLETTLRDLKAKLETKAAKT